MNLSQAKFIIVKGGFAVEIDVVKAFTRSLVDVRPVKEAPDIENTIQDFKVIKLDYKEIMLYYQERLY